MPHTSVLILQCTCLDFPLHLLWFPSMYFLDLWMFPAFTCSQISSSFSLVSLVQGGPQKCPYFSLAITFTKIRKPWRFFSAQLLEVYRILLVETTLEWIMFYYTFSVINTLYDPCTRLLYDSTAATGTLKLSTTLLSISCGIHLISPLMMSSLVCGLLSQTCHLISQTEHLNTLGITSHGTDSFCIKPISPDHPIPKISTRLTIFWVGSWKTKFVKTIHRQERASSEKKSDGLHKKCSIELWAILLFELLLCYHTAARCMERT